MQLEAGIIKDIDNLIKKFRQSPRLELEIAFRGINSADYLRISENYVNRVSVDQIVGLEELDINLALSDGRIYRITLSDPDEIEKFLEKNGQVRYGDLKNAILSLKPSKTISMMFKDRGNAERIEVPDYSFVVKLTEEVATKESIRDYEKIVFRYKKRYSINLNENVRIDLTEVQESNWLNRLADQSTKYEVEMEVINRKISAKQFYLELEDALRVEQGSELPISRTEMKEVIGQYHSLLGLEPGRRLIKRNVVTLEIQHIIKFLANRYAVTEKADGER